MAKTMLQFKMVQPKFSPGLGEIDGKMISTWNLDSGIITFLGEQFHKGWKFQEAKLYMRDYPTPTVTSICVSSSNQQTWVFTGG